MSWSWSGLVLHFGKCLANAVLIFLKSCRVSLSLVFATIRKLWSCEIARTKPRQTLKNKTEVWICETRASCKRGNTRRKLFCWSIIPQHMYPNSPHTLRSYTVLVSNQDFFLLIFNFTCYVTNRWIYKVCCKYTFFDFST